MTGIEKAISTYEPRKEAIGQLLSLNNPSIIVPNWQRNYSWKSEHIETFWNDIDYFMSKEAQAIKGEYFLGSIVIIRTQDGSLNLLDGQQRLSTSAILLSVIRDAIKDYSADAAKQIQESYLVGYDFIAAKAVHKLRLNLYDQEYFRRLILDPRDGDYKEPEAEIPSHNLMKSARQIFEEKVASKVLGMPPKAAFETCMAIGRCLLQNMTVIAVYSTDEDSAAEVFETLNDRGIGLSTPDLLRNLIIRRATAGTQATVIELWRAVISFDADNAIKNFLRHFWVSRYGDVKTQSLYREIKQVVQADNIDSLALSTNLKDSSDLYRQIVRAETDIVELNPYFAEISDFGSSSNILYPVLLSIMEELQSKDATRAVSTLLNVFVRHSIINGLENSRLENRIYRAARDLRISKNVSSFCDAVVAGAPDDEQTQRAFERLSVLHNGTRRNLLTRLELAARGTEELDVASSMRVHVEHIYPQTPKEGAMWPKHESIVNRLGNLTLLSARLNKAIQNGNFEEKKPSFAKSEIAITKVLGDLNEWSPEQIDIRQRAMAVVVPKLWPLNP